MTSRANRGIASFVLRFTQELWQGKNGEPQIQWRGHIRHVQGQEEDRFTDFSEAVTFMQRNLANLTMNTASRKNMNQEDVLRESFKFWEDFSTVYSSMMFEAMEQSLKQSETVKQRVHDAVEQTLQAWQVAPKMEEQPYQTQMMLMLQKLHNQVETLSQKVDDLEQQLAEKKS